jgi:hypothetical protein
MKDDELVIEVDLNEYEDWNNDLTGCSENIN